MRYILSSIFFIVCAMLPKAAAEGVKNGLEICCSMVIPSLYPLMFSSLLLMRTGAARIISKPFSAVLCRILKLPQETGFALFASMCGGYPAGAAAVRELYAGGVIDRKQAERLAYIAVSAGPAFVLGAVGGGIYNNSAVGFLLLGVLCASVVITGVLVTVLSKDKNNKTVMIRAVEREEGNVFVRSALDSADTLLSVCVFVVLFACLRSLADATGAGSVLCSMLKAAGVPENYAEAALPVLLEVSGGCIEASEVGFPTVAFALGFGGLSVHFQIFSVLDDVPVSKLKFIMIRLVQGIVCALLTAMTMHFLPEKAVYAVTVEGEFRAMPTAAGSVCLIVMCLMAVMCLPKPLTKGEKRV